MNDPQIESLRKTLRLKAKANQGELQVASSDVLALLDEIGRLAQSNDRLRRQNKRLRSKGKGGTEEPVESEGGAESEEVDD